MLVLSICRALVIILTKERAGQLAAYRLRIYAC
jgi:hypothetical protein